MLTNTHPIGYYTYTDSKTEESVKCVCPSIVSKSLWDQCQQQRINISTRKGQKNRTKRFYLLRDLMYCGHCGSHMSGRIKESKNEYLYYCPHRERSWVKLPPKQHEKWKRNNGCDMNRSLNITAVDELVKKEIGTEVFFTKMVEKYQETRRNHLQETDGKSREENILILKTRRKKFEKELDMVIEQVAELETEKRLKNKDHRVIDKILERMHAQMKTIEENIEQTSCKIEQLVNDFEMDQNVINVDFGNAAYEMLQIARSETDTKELLESFIKRIDVFYDQKKSEHKLVVHVKKTVLNNDYKVQLLSKKKNA